MMIVDKKEVQREVRPNIEARGNDYSSVHSALFITMLYIWISNWIKNVEFSMHQLYKEWMYINPKDMCESDHKTLIEKH